MAAASQSIADGLEALAAVPSEFAEIFTPEASGSVATLHPDSGRPWTRDRRRFGPTTAPMPMLAAGTGWPVRSSMMSPPVSHSSSP